MMGSPCQLIKSYYNTLCYLRVSISKFKNNIINHIFINYMYQKSNIFHTHFIYLIKKIVSITPIWLAVDFESTLFYNKIN